jgi:hypothetical protein
MLSDNQQHGDATTYFRLDHLHMDVWYGGWIQGLERYICILGRRQA